ncbi:MAG TPA: acyl-CoA thioesterase [Salinimicrobium sp.]|nr:acyl-CoA thioesterase [Salinimicrobium sp.]
MEYEVFEREITVSEKDLDDLNHVNNVQYVQWIQDIAKQHWEIKGSKELKEKYIWVVIHHDISYKQQAFLNDKIKLQTYVGETTFVTSKRFVNILNSQTGEILVEAVSKWCLLDADTKKPIKITKELKEVFAKQS